ncbi:NADPH-dependent FMN reductase [Bacteroidota bacterium]
MKRIVAIGGSNSKKSINKTLAIYAANQLKNTETIVADLNDFELPLFGVDLETEIGIPEEATRLNNLLESADGLVISLAENNGSYSTAFKNVFDWLSRINRQVWKGKPMLLMATSPGPRGGSRVLKTSMETFPLYQGNIIANFSLPSFNDNFSKDSFTNEKLSTELNQKINILQEAI